MYFQIPRLAADAGPLQDGDVVGHVQQSQLERFYRRLPFVSNIIALRRDSGAGQTFTDISAEAPPGATGDFLPWGDNAAFSAGDELWISTANDDHVCELYLYIDTPGAWTGDGLEVLLSNDGDTLTPVAGMTDASNGMRNAAGVYRVKWTHDAANHKQIRPYYGAEKKKYIVLRPKGLTAKTTAPILRGIWAACPETVEVYENATSIFNGDIASSTYTQSVPSILIIDTTEAWFGLKGLSMGLDWFIHQSLENVSDREYHYWTGSELKLLQNVVDGSVGQENGPTTLGTARTDSSMRWTVPTDWPKTTKDFGDGPVEAYWMRMHPSQVTQYRPSRVLYARLRSRSFGSGLSYGRKLAAAVSYTTVNYQADTPPASEMKVNFLNCQTGAGQTLTVAAGVEDGNGTFSSALAIGAGQEIMISHAGGGAAEGVKFWLS